MLGITLNITGMILCTFLTAAWIIFNHNKTNILPSVKRELLYYVGMFFANAASLLINKSTNSIYLSVVGFCFGVIAIFSSSMFFVSYIKSTKNTSEPHPKKMEIFYLITVSFLGLVCVIIHIINFIGIV